MVQNAVKMFGRAKYNGRLNTEQNFKVISHSIDPKGGEIVKTVLLEKKLHLQQLRTLAKLWS
jgi:hypothetical protein